MPRRQLLCNKAFGDVQSFFFVLVHAHKQVCCDNEIVHRPSREFESFLEKGHGILNKAGRARIVEDDSVRVLTGESEHCWSRGTDIDG